jgi:hypothetical protein
MPKKTTSKANPANANLDGTPGKAGGKAKAKAAATPTSGFHDKTEDEQYAIVLEMTSGNDDMAKTLWAQLKGNAEEDSDEEESPAATSKLEGWAERWVQFFQLVQVTFTQVGRVASFEYNLWTNLAILYGTFGEKDTGNPLDTAEQNTALWKFITKYGFVVDVWALRNFQDTIPSLESLELATLATSGSASNEKQQQRFAEQLITMRAKISAAMSNKARKISPYELTSIFYKYLCKINEKVAESGINAITAAWVHNWTIQIQTFVQSIETAIVLGPTDSPSFDAELVEEFVKIWLQRRNNATVPDFSQTSDNIKPLIDDWRARGTAQKREAAAQEEESARRGMPKRQDGSRARSRSRSPNRNRGRTTSPPRSSSAPAQNRDRRRSRSPVSGGRHANPAAAGKPANQRPHSHRDEQSAWRTEAADGHTRDNARSYTRTKPDTETQLQTLQRHERDNCDDNKRKTLALCSNFNKSGKTKCAGDKCQYYHACSVCIYNKSVKLTDCYHRRCEK